MKLEKLSNNFTPLHQGVFFGIDSEEGTPTDILVEIIDDATNEVVATQQLRGVTAGEVNIAHYVHLLDKCTPASPSHSHFCEAPTATYRIRVGEEVSAPVTLSVNSDYPASLPALLSTMPCSRTISRSESDELFLLGEAGATYTAHIVANTGEMLSLEYSSPTGAATLSISTEDFGAKATALNVELLCNGVSLGTLHYTLRPRYNGSVRVAWLSKRGTIERYTFPTTTKVRYTSQKRVVERLGGQQVASLSSMCNLTLITRYEPRDTIVALADIICSPKVWIESEGVWAEVVVTSTILDHNLFGEPDSLRIDICKWSREEGVL